MDAKVLVKTDNLSREEWLEWRKKGMSGSDAAAILGLNPYVSPFQVYMDKLGLLKEDEDNEAMRQGRDLEAYVASRFMEETGLKVRKVNRILQHPEHEWMIGNIDRWIVGKNAGLECKTTSVLNKHKFSQGEFPANYYVQCMHYMALTGADEWYLAVLVLNKGFHIFNIKRDEDEINALIEAEKNFWENYVLKQIPPAPDGSSSASEVINSLYTCAKPGEKIALFGHEEKLQKIIELKAKVKEIEAEIDSLQQEIQLEMKDAEIGTALGYTVTWKNQTTNRLDTTKLKKEKPEIYEAYLKTSSYRRFEIKKEAE